LLITFEQKAFRTKKGARKMLEKINTWCCIFIDIGYRAKSCKLFKIESDITNIWKKWKIRTKFKIKRRKILKTNPLLDRIFILRPLRKASKSEPNMNQKLGTYINRKNLEPSKSIEYMTGFCICWFVFLL